MSNQQDTKKKNPNVPNLRFQFSEVWTDRSLGDLMDFQNGLNAESGKYGRGIKFISVGDILENDYITYDSIKGQVDASEKEKKAFCVQLGDIVFQRSSETPSDIGRSNAYLDLRPCLFGGFVIRGRKKADYQPYFLKTALQSPTNRKKVVRLGAGAQHFNIGQESLKTVSICLPSMPEQEKIASLFMKISKRIEIQNKIIEDYVRLKEETLRRLFSNRGKFNKGDEEPLSKFLHPGSKEPVDPLKYKRITIHLNLEGLSFSDQTRELKDSRPFFVRRAGELIIGKQNYFNGSICLVDKEYDMAVCSNAIMSFEITGINPRFLLHATSNKGFLEARKFYANGTGQKELSEKDFLNFSINVPDRSLQVAIANAVDSIENKILFERQTLRRYVEMKKYLLSVMFI